MNRVVVILGLVTAVALTMTSAFAWGPGRGSGPPWAPAGLSAEQSQQIQKIRTERIAEMTQLRNEMFVKRSELAALLREPVVDGEKIAAKQQEIVTLQAEMQGKALAARTAVAEILTPEQRAQMPAWGPGFRGGRGMGMGFGPRW